MDPTAVRLAVKLTPREVAALRAALVHVQHDPRGLSEMARADLQPSDYLTDTEINSVVAVLGHAADVVVITEVGTAITADDRALQLLREAFELLNNDDSSLDRRDWTREARKLLRVDRSEPATAGELPLPPIDPRD